jgi:hypothetical protein
MATWPIHPNVLLQVHDRDTNKPNKAVLLDIATPHRTEMYFLFLPLSCAHSHLIVFTTPTVVSAS